jgi:hypothetical protein
MKLSSIRFLSAESHPRMLAHKWGGLSSLPIGNEYEQRLPSKPVVRQATKNTEGLNGPSWSWISIPKPIRFRILGIRFTLEIVNVQIQHSLEAARFGNVNFGQLTVRGPVKHATVSGNTSVEPPNGSPSSTGDTVLWMKLGEDKFIESDSSQKAICLELQRMTERAWVRVRLSEKSDDGWLETRTITII